MEATAAARCAGAAGLPPVNLWALPKESHRGGLEFPVPLAATTKAARSLAVSAIGFQKCFVLLKLTSKYFHRTVSPLPGGVRNNPLPGLHPEGCLCVRCLGARASISDNPYTVHLHSLSALCLGCPGLLVFLSLKMA